MTAPSDPYAELTSLRRIAEAYGSGMSLDAKWDVMRRHRTTTEGFEDWLISLLPVSACTRVLDVGAGSGRFAIPLGRSMRGTPGSVVALDVLYDVMDPIRAAASRDGLKIETTVGNAAALDRSLGQFDIVLAAHMLYHLEVITVGVRAMRDRLAPGGTFAATTNAAAGMPELFELHAATMRSLGLAFHDGPPPERFTLENGAAILGEVFDEVETFVYDGGFTAPSADPVFTYYAATELYRSAMRDDQIPLDTRIRIAPTFVHLAQQLIDHQGGPLLIHKEIGVFRCR